MKISRNKIDICRARERIKRVLRWFLPIREAAAKSPYEDRSFGWQKRIPEWLYGLANSILNSVSR